MAKHGDFEPPSRVPDNLLFLNSSVLAAMFSFPNDMTRVETEVNRLDNQALVHYYDDDWRSLR